MRVTTVMIYVFQLAAVRAWRCLLNTVLWVVTQILFLSRNLTPKNILIFKVGNIGDLVCATPSFIAIRKAYPDAYITLLSSPGSCGAVGATELFENARYFDAVRVYHTEDTYSFFKKKEFIGVLRKEKYDLFIQLPDDLVNFRTLFKNILFAKLIGVKRAFGFTIRTVQLFKKIQVDHTTQQSEVESLLDILKKNNVPVGDVEYSFSITEAHKRKVSEIIENKWGTLPNDSLVVAINIGAKREANRWFPERFGEVARYLENTYGARLVIIGGKEDVALANIVQRYVSKKGVLVVAGVFGLLETIALLGRVRFLISNDTGATHMAAAVELPVIGIYSIRNVFGRWFPYGKNHEIICHRNFTCDYRTESCIQESIEMVSVDEVITACDRMIGKIQVK